MADDLDNARQLWQGLLTAKQMTDLGLDSDNKENKGASNKRHKRQTTPLQHSSDHQRKDQTELLRSLARLCLRHEDTLNVLLVEHQYILHITPGDGSALPILLQKTMEWKQNSQQQPITLRHSLALALVETVAARLTTLQQAPNTEEMFKECLALNLIDADRNMPFQFWCQKAQKLLPSKERSMPLAEVLHTMNSLVRIMKDDGNVTLRFHALTKMTSEEKVKTVPFLWTIRCRENGEVWSLLQTLCFHSVWRLARASLRAQNLQRSNLAKQIQQLL